MMNLPIGTTTDLFARRYGEHEALRRLADIGFAAVDYSMFIYDVHRGIYAQAGYLDFAAQLKKTADQAGITFGQVHAPFPSYVNNPVEDEFILTQLIRSVEVTGVLKAPYVVIHPAILEKRRYDAFKEENKVINMQMYRALIPYCEKANVKIGIENMWNRDPAAGGKICPTVCSTSEEMAEFVDELGPWFVNCLDTGHALLTQDTPGNMVRELGRRVQLLHIHDNDGIDDLHTAPFQHLIDWTDFMASLKEMDYTGTLSLEADSFYAKFPEALTMEAAKLLYKIGCHLNTLA